MNNLEDDYQKFRDEMAESSLVEEDPPGGLPEMFEWYTVNQEYQGTPIHRKIVREATSHWLTKHDPKTQDLEDEAERILANRSEVYLSHTDQQKSNGAWEGRMDATFANTHTSASISAPSEIGTNRIRLDWSLRRMMGDNIPDQVIRSIRHEVGHEIKKRLNPLQKKLTESNQEDLEGRQSFHNSPERASSELISVYEEDRNFEARSRPHYEALGNPLDSVDQILGVLETGRENVLGETQPRFEINNEPYQIFHRPENRSVEEDHDVDIVFPEPYSLARMTVCNVYRMFDEREDVEDPRDYIEDFVLNTAQTASGVEGILENSLEERGFPNTVNHFRDYFEDLLRTGYERNSWDAESQKAKANDLAKEMLNEDIDTPESYSRARALQLAYSEAPLSTSNLPFSRNHTMIDELEREADEFRENY